MSRLEQKLVELGYKQDEFCLAYYYKYINYGFLFKIFLKDNNKNIKRKDIWFGCYEMNLDVVEKLCNEMQKDLEILKECEG